MPYSCFTINFIELLNISMNNWNFDKKKTENLMKIWWQFDNILKFGWIYNEILEFWWKFEILEILMKFWNFDENLKFSMKIWNFDEKKIKFWCWEL